ncbi:MAG: NAAT family transporter [Ignavibacteria bacterium]|nr:NAAT family transporter [Ignavibacteria bacterium]
MQDITYYIKIFIALSVLVNPIEGIPVFLSNTRGQTIQQKADIYKKTSIAVFIILMISLFFGRYILTLFGISIPSFSLAGGIIIFIIALQMVLSKDDSGEKSLTKATDSDYSDIAVVPLAIPLLAGPGAISSIIVYGSRSSGILDDVFLSGIVLLVSVFVFFSFRATTRMEKALSPARIKIITKISGLLVAAIAIELIFSSVTNLIKIHQSTQ